MVRRQSTISNLLALLLAALLAAVVVSAEYPNDTPVYWNFPDDGGWWSGKIISYDADNEMYSIEWEDASVEYYDNTDQVDQMVANANNDPDFNSNSIPQYVDGTELSMKEDGVWYDGTIVSFDSDKQLYTIEWSHTKGETEEIAPGAVLDQMVTDAQLTDDQVSDDAILEPGQSHSVPDDSACLHSVGTEVSYWDTEDQRWYDGAVTGCAGTDGFHPTTYEIQWQPDGEIEDVVDPDTINQYVAYAQKDDDLPPGVYAKGTAVYKEFFGEGWWIGEIIHYENNVYTVRWIDDSSVDMFDAGDEMDQMVVDAQYIPNTDDDGTIKNGPVRPATAQAPPPATSSSNKKSPAGAVFLSLFIIAVVGALGFVGMRYRSKKLVQQARQESGLDAEPPIEDNITYRDEPDDSKVSKII